MCNRPRRDGFREYNWVGPGAKQHLAHAIDLFNSKGFVRYFPDFNGDIWRITDCWQDFYDIHSWSNLACFNDKIPEAAALNREDFENAIKKGHRYE
jgi:hypothetical protein